jgi:hypothetical protein
VRSSATGHLFTEHSADALVIAAGAGVQPAEGEPEADPLGLAPTLLALADVPVPRSMPGEPWVEMICG